MKKILLTTVASTLIAMTIGGVAQARTSNGYSGSTNVWAWNINVPPLKAAAKAFMKTHPQAHIKITEVGREDLYKKLSTGLMSHGKGLPDATLIEDSNFDSFVKIYPRSFVNVGTMGYDKLANLFPNYKSNSFKYKSHMYGFPFDGGPAMVFYRRSVFAKAGVKPSQIKTWDDFLKYGKIIKAKTGKYMFSGSDNAIYLVMLGQYGKSYFDTKGNIDLKSPASVKALKMLKKMNDAGILDHCSPGWDPYMRDIASGNLVAIPQGIWLEGNIETVAPKTKGDWGVFPLPINGDGDVSASAQGGSGFVMLNKSKNKTLTYNFLKYFTTAKQSQVTAFKGGLFPTLGKVYKTKEFNAGVPFFKNQHVWAEGAKVIKKIKPVHYTQDYFYGNAEVKKMYSGIMFAHADVMKRLDQATKALKARTGRKINQYK